MHEIKTKNSRTQRADAQPEQTEPHPHVRLRERKALQELPRSERRKRAAHQARRGILSPDIGRQRPIRYFSTFTGIGGFEIGIHRAIAARQKQRGPTRRGADTQRQRLGAQPLCVGFSEVDKYATQIYQRHFPSHTNYGDITKIAAEELPDFDFLFGGFPCQAFSIAGKRGGFDDTRGTLFFDLARIAAAKKPRLLLFENVKGLLSHDEGRTFRTIICTLDELGYDLQWQVLNSKNHGVPQNRERVLIVGHLRGTPRPEVFPFGGGNEADAPEDLRQSENISGTISTRSQGPQCQFDGGSTLVDEDIIGTINRQEFRETGGVALNIPATYYKGHDNHGARSVVARGTSIRRLTPVECERLQGFPDGWTEGVSDTQRYKTLGNAVTVNVIADVCERLLL